jgi:hypothetical protein
MRPDERAVGVSDASRAVGGLLLLLLSAERVPVGVMLLERASEQSSTLAST